MAIKKENKDVTPQAEESVFEGLNAEESGISFEIEEPKKEDTPTAAVAVVVEEPKKEDTPAAPVAVVEEPKKEETPAVAVVEEAKKEETPAASGN